MAKKTYRAILIDPEMRRIETLETEVSNDEMHRLVGAETLDSFALAAFDGGYRDFGWIDDGGMSRGEPIHAFLLPSSKDPIAGKCLIIGANRQGETTSCRIPIEVLRQDVTWLGRIKPEVTWDHTELGSRAIVTYSRIKES